MTTKPKTSKKPNLAVILTIILVVVFAFVFAIAFIVSSTSATDATTVTVDSYREEVESALVEADPTIGEQLINDQICVVCHVQGNTSIAPHFTGIANRAGERHPPLDAEQYLYESIMYPTNFVVEGYAPSMPNDYHNILTQQEIGHIIAYLMTLTEEADES